MLEKFDLVINMATWDQMFYPSLFVTNQFRPRLWKSRSYLYPGLSKILVADSAPPYTICEYNLNFSDDVKEKVLYVGHFASKVKNLVGEKSDLELLIQDKDYGYWVRTGNNITNKGTGEKYTRVFSKQEMAKERRIISHAQNDQSIDSVLGFDGKRYSITEAYEKKIDWLQIDVGFLSELQKETVLDGCRYVVVNGSHTVMGEVLGGKAKPIIGMPVYDEHENNIRWAQEKNLGMLAKNTKDTILAVDKIKENATLFDDALAEFSRNFDGNGAQRAAKEAAITLENKR